LLASERISVESAFFDPSAERARQLDRRMRHRLAESMRYVAAQTAGRLTPPPERLASFLQQLERGPVSPHCFGAYYDLVLALDDDHLDEAEQHLREMLAAPPPQDGLRILALGESAHDPDVDRMRRHLDTDPTLSLAVVPPPPDVAATCRRRIGAALALIDSANHELAAEIGELVREIVLALGTSAPGTLHFDGAASFMLWGAIFLNAASHETTVEMVQALAHESGHSLLFGLSTDGPLLENDEDERYVSPLRSDPRPIDGIFHATFVTARMHQAVARLLEAGALVGGELDEAKRALETNAALFAEGLATLDRHARPTSMGSAVLAGARAYMEHAARQVSG
jgi:HEXXH motif-containing protein